MREYLEVLVNTEHADLVFRKDEGKLLGSGIVRSIEISTSDPRFAKVGDVHRSLESEGKSLFFGWSIRNETYRIDGRRRFRTVPSR